MSNKILLVGDVHLRHDNLDVANIFFTELENVLRSGDYSRIVFMGDVFDVKGIIRVEVQNFFYRWINKLADCGYIHIIVGNHDMVGFVGDEHAFKFIYDVGIGEGHCKHFTIHDRAMALHFGNLNVIMMPYIKDGLEWTAKVNALIKKIKDSPDDAEVETIVLCHQEFKGHWFNGWTHKVGDEGVDEEQLFELKKIFSGHIHLYQGSDKVQYVGVPFSHNFGESNIWTGVVELICGERGLDDYKQIQLPNIPKHFTYNVPIKSERLFWDIIDFEHSDIDSVRFIVSGTKSQCLALATKDMIIANLKRMSVAIPRQIIVKYEFDDVIDSELTIKETDTYQSMFSGYVGKVYADNKSKDTIMRLGNKIIQHVVGGGDAT